MKSRTQMRSDAEVRSAFESLTPEQQEKLRKSCEDPNTNVRTPQGQEVCDAIAKL